MCFSSNSGDSESDLDDSSTSDSGSSTGPEWKGIDLDNASASNLESNTGLEWKVIELEHCSEHSSSECMYYLACLWVPLTIF
jgi:hypothetical protein